MLFRAEWDQLLLAARGGDPAALGRLLESAGDDLHAAAAGVVGHKVQERLPVEDVYAESLLAVVKDFGSLRATSYVGFRYWFASIARNSVLRTLRRERARPELRSDEEELDGGEGGAREPHAFVRESLYLARDVLDRMPRSQQLAYALREGLGLSWHTIAFVLGRRSAAAARLVHYRASQRVQASRPRIGALPVIVA